MDDAAEDRLAAAVPVGPRLALEIIEDGMVRSLPKWRDRLITHGLRVLDEQPAADISTITRGLVRFADTGDDQRSLVAEALRGALGGHAISRDTAARLQALIPSIAHEVGAGHNVQGLSHVRRRPEIPLPPDKAGKWDEFDDEIATHPVPKTTLVVLSRAADLLRQIAKQETAGEDAIEAIVIALADAEAAKALASALSHVIQHEAVLMRVLRDVVLPTVYRRPVGIKLRS
ncbi:hypothetical protein [Protofrankia symbiont of Coriaria ruscifolia]|uniref:hypothetical protein n=1 Tax=Protofrankia symbiont of Coriaria ruscifolia TaxID=1306542 RepID=UPI0010412FDA|nr:hypothetical protein [Protofrankia symbiont of Coriaria ruscifolia]